MTAPLLGSWAGLPTGEQARRAVVVATLGSFAVAVVVATVGAFRPYVGPLWPFGLPSLVPLAAVAVLWKPERRVENAWLHLGLGAFFLGLFGAAWGALWSLPVSVLVLLTMLIAPKSKAQRRSGSRADR